MDFEKLFVVGVFFVSAAALGAVIYSEATGKGGTCSTAQICVSIICPDELKDKCEQLKKAIAQANEAGRWCVP